MLTDAHARHLARFRVAPRMLEAACIRSVSDADTRELLGVHGRRNEDLSGILFPYQHPFTGERTGARVRLDHPSDKMKYLTEAGCRSLFFPPGIPPEWLSEISIPVVFVEAEKSALSLWAWAQRQGLNRIFVATGGVWGWRRTVGRVDTAEGGSKPIKGPSPDFDLLRWEGRDVIVLFDSNVAVKFEIDMARHTFARRLRTRNAKVLFAEVPIIAGVNGPDDFIAIATDDEVAERIFGKAVVFSEKQEDAEMTQAAQMVDGVAGTATLFHAEQTGYAIITVDDHQETWRIGSKMFRQYICHEFFRKTQKAPGSQVVLSAVNLLEAQANFQGPEQEVHVRVAEHDGALWLDLANKKWQAVRVTKEGWAVVDNPPVRFLRPPGLLPLPIPEPKGKIEDLKPFLSLATDDDFILVVAFLVATLRPRGPYAVLVIVSEQGSGKTTTSRMIRRLVDPNFAMTRGEPRENQDLAIACRNGHVVALDNVSHLQSWLSDTLARISTGDAFATRALYTDADEVLFAACRPILLNGITAIPHRPDLLDRSVIVNCSTIPDDRRRPEDELWEEFTSAEPKILGALLSAVATALSRIDQVKLDQLPRMADFAKWICAAEPSLPWEKGRFVRVYGGNRRDAIEQI